MPIYPKQSAPSWLIPQDSSSVITPTWKKVTRAIGGLIGANDPSSQVMAPVAPLMAGEGRAIKALKNVLPMDEASRMGRATEQGYTHDMYHGTRDAFNEFKDAIKSGTYGEGDFGIHVTPDPNTASRALRSTDPYAKFPEKLLVKPLERGGQIMPLKVKMNKTFHMPQDVGVWRNPDNWLHRRDHDVNNFLNSNTNDVNMLNQLIDEAHTISDNYTGIYNKLMEDPSGEIRSLKWQQKMKELLQQNGYDSVSYPNMVEGMGENSYMLLDPRQIKSRFARFDPAAFGKSKDIMSSLTPPAALAGLMRAHKSSNESK